MLAELEALIDDKGATQRERLGALRARSAEVAALADDDLYRLLRLVRKTINSKKLRSACDELIGDCRRDGKAGAAELPAAAKAAPEKLESVEPTTVAPTAASAASAPFNAELDDVVAADPRAKDSYLVYRDWLEGRGLANEGRVTLWPAEDCSDMLASVDWHLGFIRALELRFTSERFNRKGASSFEDALTWLLEDPGAARFVRELTLGLVCHDANDYEAACKIIGRRTRPALETLFVGDFGYEECELNWTSIKGADAMWPALPRLRKLTLRAGSMVLGDISLPELRSFSTITGGLDNDGVRSVANAHWPKLERLSLQIGCGHQGAANDPDTVSPILDGESLPALRHLGIENCEFTDEICQRLPSSKILRRLESLDLSMGTMSAVGARAISANRPAFAHLKRLVVDDNYIDPDAAALLVGVCPDVVIGDQRTDDGDEGSRYASAYE